MAAGLRLEGWIRWKRPSWSFFLKSNSSSQQIWYNTNSSLFGHAIISVFVYSVGFFSSNVVDNDLAIMYLSYFCIYMLNFCR